MRTQEEIKERIKSELKRLAPLRAVFGDKILVGGLATCLSFDDAVEMKVISSDTPRQLWTIYGDITEDRLRILLLKTSQAIIAIEERGSPSDIVSKLTMFFLIHSFAWLLGMDELVKNLEQDGGNREKWLSHVKTIIEPPMVVVA